MRNDAFADLFSSVRVRLADGTELSGADGLQVWMALHEKKRDPENGEAA